ncbi:MAG: pyridoxamine 5'-phosphate oxidase family protein [Saonia sp.]
MIKDLNSVECTRLLRDNYIGRLAYIVGQSPYVIPITYFFGNHNSNGIISYSLEGHKINAMRKNQSVAIEVDEIESVDRWKSVLVHGKFDELSGIDAKNLLHEFAQGVKGIIKRKEEKELQFIHEFSSKLGAKSSSPIVYRIKILEITGKQKI